MKSSSTRNGIEPKRYAESYVDPLNPDPATSDAPYRVFNIGKSQLTLLKDYVQALKQAIGKEAWKNFLPIQLGQVPATNADTNELDAWSGFKPGTPVRKGVQRFCRWYSAHYAQAKKAPSSLHWSSMPMTPSAGLTLLDEQTP